MIKLERERPAPQESDPLAQTANDPTIPQSSPRRPSARARGRLLGRLALALAVLLPALGTGGCVERVRNEENLVPLWERYDNVSLNMKERAFVRRKIQVGGRTECKGDDYFHEQTTEISARVLTKDEEFSPPAKQITLQLEYLSGLFQGVTTQEIVEKTNMASLSETLKISLNGGASCPCVRILGIMKVIDKYQVMRITEVCPAQKA